MDGRLVGALVVLACMAAAIPWRMVIDGTDVAFVVFALAPPLVFAAGLGVRSVRAPDALRGDTDGANHA